MPFWDMQTSTGEIQTSPAADAAILLNKCLTIIIGDKLAEEREILKFYQIVFKKVFDLLN